MDSRDIFLLGWAGSLQGLAGCDFFRRSVLTIIETVAAIDRLFVSRGVVWWWDCGRWRGVPVHERMTAEAFSV